MTKTYEELIQRLANRVKDYSTPLMYAGIAIGGVVLGIWGYKAGNIGGAILFTIAGFFLGGMIGLEMPKSIIAALGTARRTMILLGLIGVSILLSYIFNSLPLGFLLFLAICVYLYYLRSQALP